MSVARQISVSLIVYEHQYGTRFVHASLVRLVGGRLRTTSKFDGLPPPSTFIVALIVDRIGETKWVHDYGRRVSSTVCPPPQPSSSP